MQWAGNRPRLKYKTLQAFHWTQGGEGEYGKSGSTRLKLGALTGRLRPLVVTVGIGSSSSEISTSSSSISSVTCRAGPLFHVGIRLRSKVAVSTFVLKGGRCHLPSPPLRPGMSEEQMK